MGRGGEEKVVESLCRGSEKPIYWVHTVASESSLDKFKEVPKNRDDPSLSLSALIRSNLSLSALSFSLLSF